MRRQNRVLIRSVSPHFILWVTNLLSNLAIIVSIRVYNIPLLVLNLLLAVAVSMFFELSLIYLFFAIFRRSLNNELFFIFFRDFSSNVIKELHNEIFMNLRSLLRL